MDSGLGSGAYAETQLSRSKERGRLFLHGRARGASHEAAKNEADCNRPQPAVLLSKSHQGRPEKERPYRLGNRPGETGVAEARQSRSELLASGICARSEKLLNVRGAHAVGAGGAASRSSRHCSQYFIDGQG